MDEGTGIPGLSGVAEAMRTVGSMGEGGGEFLGGVESVREME